MQTGLCLCCFHCNGDQPDIIIARRTIFLQINSRKNVRHERRDDQRANETQFRFNFCEKIFMRLLPKKIDPKHFPFCSVIRVHEKKKKKKIRKKHECTSNERTRRKRKFLFSFRRSADNHDLRDGHRHAGKYYCNRLSYCAG